MAPRPIIVLGAERSGTSATAEAIHRWGAYPGEPSNLPTPEPRNARGRWEFEPLWDLLAEIGQFSHGLSWWDETFPKLVQEQANNPDLVAKGHALVRLMEAKNRPWVWKDPALCHFLTFWLPIWHDPVFVITVRHPVDIAVSWSQCTADAGMPTDPALNLLRWQKMLLNVLEHTDGLPNRHFIVYEQLMTDPTTQLTRLAGFLDHAIGGDSDGEMIESMMRACDTRLWHNRNTTSDDVALSTTQQNLCQHLLDLADNPTIPFVNDYPMPADWRARLLAQDTPAAPPAQGSQSCT